MFRLFQVNSVVDGECTVLMKSCQFMKKHDIYPNCICAESNGKGMSTVSGEPNKASQGR